MIEGKIPLGPFAALPPRQHVAFGLLVVDGVLGCFDAHPTGVRRADPAFPLDLSAAAQLPNMDVPLATKIDEQQASVSEICPGLISLLLFVSRDAANQGGAMMDIFDSDLHSLTSEREGCSLRNKAPASRNRPVVRID
jgi:hypothetical protein